MTSSSELKDLYTPPEKMFVSHRIAARYNLDAIIENLKSSLENENCANFNSFIFGSVSVSRRTMVKPKINIDRIFENSEIRNLEKSAKINAKLNNLIVFQSVIPRIQHA